MATYLKAHEKYLADLSEKERNLFDMREEKHLKQKISRRTTESTEVQDNDAGIKCYLSEKKKFYMLIHTDKGEETRDEETPVVTTRRVTPANRPLQLLEAGRLGASSTEHLPSRPAVTDLCIASSSLLSVLDPLPLDRLSRHTGGEILLWPAADRHAVLAVAHRDVRVARQNIAEMMLYIDDHAAHLAHCASAGDDTLTLMSTELVPRLEGGIRAVLDEAANL